MAVEFAASRSGTRESADPLAAEDGL